MLGKASCYEETMIAARALTDVKVVGGVGRAEAVSYTHLTLPTIYSV